MTMTKKQPDDEDDSWLEGGPTDKPVRRIMSRPAPPDYYPDPGSAPPSRGVHRSHFMQRQSRFMLGRDD